MFRHSSLTVALLFGVPALAFAAAPLRQALPPAAAADAQTQDHEGTHLLEQHRFAEAMDHFEAALAARPTDPAARDGERTAAVQHALALRSAGQAPEALACLERARTALPDDPAVLTDLGIEADALHRYAEAVDALHAALRLDPADLTATYALARTDVDSEHPLEAEALFLAYLAQRPNDASAHYGLGRLLQRQQRTEDAAAQFHRSLELQPLQTESYYQLGEMALDGGNAETARSMFTKTLDRLPTHGGALTGLGILAFRAKDYAGARQQLGAAVVAAPDYQPAHYYLGLTLARLGEKDAAAHELGLATSLAAQQQGKGAPIGIIPADAAPQR